MMLKIGNNKAFTLVEIMVASAILALGLVLIFEAFFSSLDAFNYYLNYLNAANFAEEIIWQAQDNIKRFGSLANMENSGEIDGKNEKFSWSLISLPIDNDAKLYRINLLFSWKQGKKDQKITRHAYAKFNEQQ